MAKEIERKFLVDLSKISLPADAQYLKQGYIQTRDRTAVRIRVSGEKAFLTIKGENRGATRTEFEYAIPMDDAQSMLEELCHGQMVEKHRYNIPIGEHVWELDIFEGENKGLCVAEIELKAENEGFELPDWVTEEVTHDPKYYNANLLTHPYSQW